MIAAHAQIPPGRDRYARLSVLGSSLLPRYIRQWLPDVTAVAGYYDDSFDDGGPVFVLAGYAGTVSMWDEFAARWNSIIRDLKYPPLSEFKSSDCRNGQGEFRDKFGWSKPMRDELTERLVSALLACPYTDMVGYGTATVYHRQFPDKTERRKFQDQAFEVCLRHLLHLQMETGAAVAAQTGSMMAITIDEKSKFRHFVEKHFDGIVASLGEKAVGRFKLELPGDSKKIAPLQAADLLAYETYKEVKHRIANPNRDKPIGVSRALERLVGGHHHRAHCVDYKLMRRIYAHLVRGTKPKQIRLRIRRIYDSEFAIRGPGLWKP